MKYISRYDLEENLTAFIETSKYRMKYSNDHEHVLKCEGEIKAFEAVIHTLDCVVGIDLEDDPK